MSNTINAVNFVSKHLDYSIFRKLILTLNRKNYDWTIGDSDIYTYPALDNVLTSGKYSNEFVLETLNQKIFYVFTEFYSFNFDTDNIPLSYDEYVQSECECAIFIVDCNSYSVYVKNDILFQSLIEYIKGIECKSVKMLDYESAVFHYGI